MQFSRSLAITMCAAAFFASPLAAQEFYVGALYEGTDMRLEPGGVDGQLSGFVGVAGVHAEVGGNFFVGGEVESMFAPQWSDNGSLYSSVEGQQRVRAVAGVELGSMSLFLSAGRTRFDPAGADSYDGTTFGIGAQVPVGNRVSVRVEAISDSLDINVGTQDADTQVLRAGAIINF